MNPEKIWQKERLDGYIEAMAERIFERACASEIIEGTGVEFEIIAHAAYESAIAFYEYAENKKKERSDATE